MDHIIIRSCRTIAEDDAVLMRSIVLSMLERADEGWSELVSSRPLVTRLG
jgi:hypothetical protein